MNRIKKELRKRGVKLDIDYPYLPYNTKGTFLKPGWIAIETVIVNSEKARFTEVANVGAFTFEMKRDGTIETVVEEDTNPHF